MEEFFDVVVAGSGFGGAVTACRVAEAGRSVLVLERGRWYRSGEFPGGTLEAPTDFWDPGAGAFGPFQVWPLRQLDVIVPSGVGGGSLICAAAMARMPEECFAAHATDWPLRYSDIAEHYRTVETMVTTETGVTAETVMTAKAAARTLAVAGGGSPSGGLFPASGAANLAGTHGIPGVYLAQAQRRGAEIRPLHEVKRITAVAGGYELDYVVHRPTPPPGERVARPPGQPPALRRLRARTVVLAAGALGSSWLLLTNRPGLPCLSGQLGTGFFAAEGLPGFLTLAGGRLNLNRPTDGSHRHLRDLWAGVVTKIMPRRAITTCPLGGCPMGKSPVYGVVDRHGEAFGHPGLFIADGSVLPTPVGASPSLTIAALAEHFADTIVRRSR